MASTACFLHHLAPSTAASRTPSQRLATSFRATQVVCKAQNQAGSDDESKAAISCRLALTVLVGAAALGAKVNPADAAYGEAANVFGKPKSDTDFLTYAGNGFKLLIPSKWNPSREIEYLGQVLRYEDNFDANSNLAVMVQPSDKKSITDFVSPEDFLSKVDYLLGKQAYFGKTESDVNPNLYTDTGVRNAVKQCCVLKSARFNSTYDSI